MRTNLLYNGKKSETGNNVLNSAYPLNKHDFFQGVFGGGKLSWFLTAVIKDFDKEESNFLRENSYFVLVF